MAINYGDLECSPYMIARQEREADAQLEAACQEEDEDEYLDPVWDAEEIDYRKGD